MSRRPSPSRALLVAAFACSLLLAPPGTMPGVTPGAAGAAPVSPADRPTASADRGVALAERGSMETTRPFVPADKGLSHEVFAFLLPAYQRHLLREADWSVLTTVAFFGLAARSSGHLARRTAGRPDARWTAWNGLLMDRVIARAHATRTNVVLTVTRFAWTSATRAATERLLGDPAARARLAGQIAAEVDRRGVDGVNLDFEPIPTSQRSNYVTFVRQVRSRLDAVDPGLGLTVAATGYISNYDVRGLTAEGAADAIFIMAYHYNGSWSRRAGAVSPLTRHAYDVTDTVDAYLARTRPERIILGVPYYGYRWSTLTSRVRSLTRPATSRWGYPGSVLVSSAARIAARHGRLWDALEQVPWVRWRERACGSCPMTWRQLYYEDAVSLGRKYDLVKARGLRGTGIWALGYEGARSDLDEALRRAFVID